MKKLFSVLVLVFTIFILQASEGFEVTFTQPDNVSYELSFQLGDYSLTEVTLDGVTYSKIVFEGSVFTQLKGFAELPYLNASVQLSPDKDMDLEINEGEYSDYILSSPLVPSRGVIYRDQDPSTIPYVISPGSLRNEWYPQNLARQMSPFIIKDVRGTTVYVYPFRYNAVTNILRVYHQVTVRLVESDEPATNPLTSQSDYILREMDGIYRSVFINYGINSDNLTIGDVGDILVLCTSRDETAILPYVEWKREKGYHVATQTVATGTNVKTTIQNAYNANTDLLYVLLIGDWADIKSDVLGGAPMDPQLGCVVGTDQFADICIGRLSANNADQVTVQVDKIINYEKLPEMEADWYSAALGVASNQGPGDDGELDYQHINVIYYDKLDPFTYESFSTAYDPVGTSQMVATAINNGVSIINYCGHGSSTSWGSTGFSNSHISALTNGSRLPFIFSVACVNGAFNSGGDCFAEAWLKKQNGGAVMTLMSTINQPWNPPMRGQDYFNDILIGGYDYSLHPNQNGITTTEGRTTIGSITFNGLTLMCVESGTTSDWETAKTWHIFGDPSMMPRTTAPIEVILSNTLVLSGAPFTTTITTANGSFEGAMVCLSQEGEYFRGLTDGTGTVTINHNLSPGTATLVVTGYNLETLYEEITVVPPGGAYIVVSQVVINDAGGNNNGQADYGETVLLSVSAENVGTDPATNVSALLTSSDPYVTITNDSYTFGDIGAGTVVTGADAFEIVVAQNVPDGHIALLEFEFSDASESSWFSTATIQFHAAVIELLNYSINDQNGNNNGKIDPGETVEMVVELENSGSSDAYNLIAELDCNDPFVNILNGSASYGDITAGNTGVQTFIVSALPNTPVGHSTDFELAISGEMGLQSLANITEIIGQIPVLLVDFDGNQNSASAMVEALTSMDFMYDYSADLPEDLSLYNSIFVFLGVYPDNHVLTAAEGLALADFLSAGGNLYMEGGDTWFYDEQTAVHSMFNVNATGDGGSDISTVNGMVGTFTEGMSFGYSGDNNWMDRIEPIGGAIKILENANPNYGTGIANDGGTYRTIASSHEFGGLNDGASPSTRQELLEAYLEFMGLNTLQAFFLCNVNEICEGDIIEFYDMSSGNIISWEWTFEGGMPGSSPYQNPMVMYSTAGSYDVTLTVSDGIDSHTLTLEDLIVVNVCSGINENMQKISIYPNPNNGIFTIDLGNVLNDVVTIKVLNTLGSIVYEENQIAVNGQTNRTLDLSNQYKGLYFLVIENYQGSTVNRIIIR